MTTINTVTGTITPDQLGNTLMHEHMLIGFPGWETDTIRPGKPHHEALAICQDKIDQIRDAGVASMLDPCPNDLGRDVRFMAEVADKTGFQVICATGLYHEALGGTPYWKLRANAGAGPESMAELFIHELTKGVGDTDIKAGIIKVGTGHGEAITDYEKFVLTAAAIAAKETGAPITTHTDRGQLGDAQQTFLIGQGVEPHRIIIGHSCGSSDHDYHMHILNAGSYLGFDRFGIQMFESDENRVKALMKIIEKGLIHQVVISHDTVWCWRGESIPMDDPRTREMVEKLSNPLVFHEKIIPALKAAGATDDDINTLLMENPRRFFAGEALSTQ